MKKKKLSAAVASGMAAAMLMIPANTGAEETVTTYAKDDSSALPVKLVGRYNSGAGIDAGGTEIVAYDSESQRAYSVNGGAKSLDIIDLSGLADGNQEIPLIKRVQLEALGVPASDVTSVAIHPRGEYIAVAVPSTNKTDLGHIVFLDKDGNALSSVTVGALPDMVTFTPDGNTVLSANEGEPSDDYTINPEGSVSVIDVSGDITAVAQEQVQTAAFTDDIVEAGVRKVNPDPSNSSYAENLEPEYITVDENSTYAYVAIQEANAIAKLDIANASFTTVKSLGLKDYSLENNQLDPSNKDEGIAISNWPVLGMYMPDGMTSFTSGGTTYLVTANEGDSQDWEGFSEEVRVADLAEEDLYDLNADLYQGYSQEELDTMVENGLFDEDQLGRLTTSIVAPTNEAGKYEAIYSMGGRSFSIWNADTLEQVYDSGSDFEKITAAAIPEYFNTTNDEDKLDNRSDDKGPEPETVITGAVDGTEYAFIGLERTGGIMAYDLSNPAAPAFSTYFSSRVFQGDEAAVDANSGDVAPEGLTFIPADDSPTGEELLLAAHEVSGTIAVYQLGEDTEEPNEEEPPAADPEETPGAEKPEEDPSEQEPENDPSEDQSGEDPSQEQPENNPEETPAPEDDGAENDQSNDEDQGGLSNINDDNGSSNTGNDNAESGQKLPQTAASMFNWIIAGAALLASGVGLLAYRLVKRK